MIIVLDEKNKADLAFLQQLAPNIVEEFCRISLELIRKGNVNRAIFRNAAGAFVLSFTISEGKQTHSSLRKTKTTLGHCGAWP